MATDVIPNQELLGFIDHIPFPHRYIASSLDIPQKFLCTAITQPTQFSSNGARSIESLKLCAFQYVLEPGGQFPAWQVSGK
jgi:hypothetical protein